MNRARTLLIAKHLFYTLIVFLAYILQTTPRLFALGGLKPMLLIPVATTIAMLEGEFAGGIYGAMAGLLCDLGAYTLFGFNGFLLCLGGIVVGLLTIYLVRGNWLGCLTFVLAVALIRGSVEYLFAFGMWISKPGYENVWRIYLFRVLPGVAYTVAVAPFFYLPLRAVQGRFKKAAEA